MSKGSLSSVFQRLILSLFHLLVILIPFIFTWVNEELFEFPKMLVTYGIVTGILGLWISRMIIDQRLHFKKTVFDLPIALFVISQVVSTLFSIHPYTSLFGYYTRFHGGLLSTLTYITLYYAFVNNVNRQQLRGFWVSVLAAALGVCLYAIPEHFGASPSCFLISGTFDVSCWVQDVQNRIFGTFGQPNWLAAYVITLLPIALSASLAAIFDHSHQRPQKLARSPIVAVSSWALVILLFFTLLSTQSRSGLLGLIGGLFVWAGLVSWRLIAQRKSNKPTWRSQLKIAAGLGSLTVISFVIVSLVIGKPFAPDMSQIFMRYLPQTEAPLPAPTTPLDSDTAPVVNRLDTGGTDSAEIRKIVWQGAWQVFLRYPVFGSGVETFAYSYYQDRPVAHNLVSEWDFLYNKAHNEFLNYLATTGLFGFITYSMLLIWFGIVGLKSLSRSSSALSVMDHYLIIGMIAGIVGLSISNFFGFSTVMVTILMYLFLAVVVVMGSQTDDHSEHIPQVSTLQYLSLGGVALSVLYCWSIIWSWWSADHAFTKGKQYIQAGLTMEGLQYLQSAVIQSPQEALFYDELATTYSLVAASMKSQDATTAAEIADAAILTGDETLRLNNRHLNFYKSRARIYINLSILDEKYFEQAKEALTAAITLAPTDAKLRYNLALVVQAMGQSDQARQILEETVAMKANYGAARLELARRYRDQGDITKAREQYQYLLTHINANNPVATQELQALDQPATPSARQP